MSFESLKWQPFPMLRITGLFAAGVLLGINQPDFTSLRLVGVFILVCILLFFCIQIFLTQSGMGITGALGLLIICALGYVRLVVYVHHGEDHISKIAEPIQAYEAVVRSVPEHQIMESGVGNHKHEKFSVEKNNRKIVALCFPKKHT